MPQRHTRLSSAWALLEAELVVVGAVDGAGVAPLDVELVDPDDDVVCAARVAALASCCVADMVIVQTGFAGKGPE